MNDIVQQQFSEGLIITQSSKSVRDSIPVDLLIDILSRVPAKSIARFSCVSKFWKSIFGSPYFKELFLTKSVARQRLFFALRFYPFTDDSEELFFFSLPQPQNPHENSTLVATPCKAFPKRFPTDKCTLLNGLVFLRNRVKKVLVICNLITGESLTLPKVKAKYILKSHFGFDPINKQFKVLCETRSRNGTPSHCVLTLEARKRLWRPIQDPLLLPRYHIVSNEICINGVIYFRARFGTSYKIVSFDVRSERFGLINMDNDMLHNGHMTLFNYKGHLGARQCDENEFVLWVLADAGKDKWSKVLSLWGNKRVNSNKFVGMTSTGELVFSPLFPSKRFHIFFYSIERNTFTRFKIQGFEEFKHQDIMVETFLDYVEDINKCVQ